jgi:hypothetical protein
MRAALLVVCLFCASQDDAYKILQDPARRAKDFDRQSALKFFREQSKQSPAAWIAARFLSRTDKEWKLSLDKGGPAPGAAELDAYLKTYWTGAALSDADHRKALEALELAIPKAGEGAEAHKLFMLLHASALGDRASDIISKFGYVKEGDRWGLREDLAVASIAAGLSKKSTVTGDVESKARASAAFGPKYAIGLFDLSRVFSANQGYEAAYRSLLGMGGPAASARSTEHFKALADSFKAAVYCKICKDGKMTCEQCQGKKRVDLTCPVCHGLTWMQKPGAAGSTLIRCTKCLGQGVFKNAGCPGCGQTGIINCPVCVGKPWRDGFKGCKDCAICATCKGRKQLEKDCPTCHGKGRVGPFTAGIPTATCDACKGFAILKSACPDCKESGLAPCKNCGNGVRDGKFRTKLEDVFTQKPCAVCGGKGFPLPNLAVPCEHCLGLSFIALPALDPLKTLVE